MNEQTTTTKAAAKGAGRAQYTRLVCPYCGHGHYDVSSYHKDFFMMCIDVALCDDCNRWYKYVIVRLNPPATNGIPKGEPGHKEYRFQYITTGMDQASSGCAETTPGQGEVQHG